MSRRLRLVAARAECYCFDVLSRWVSMSFAVALLASCDQEKPATDDWQIVHEDLPGALLSVWGTAHDDVWAVGADARDGNGPLVVHFDGDAWTRMPTGETLGDLWWVFGFDGGPVYMGGDGGVILRYRNGAFERMTTPGTSTVFGIWGASPDDMWAVGGDSDASGGFAWRLQNDAWVVEPSVPADVPTNAAIWKAYGSAANDVWLVGSSGVALHWDGTALTQGDTGVGSSLFTVFARDGVFAAVGGLATGIIVEADVGQPGAPWRNVTPEPPPMGLAGVTLGGEGSGIAVGMMGTIYTRDASGWTFVDPGLKVRQNLHGSWIDEEGGLWAVGGQTLTPPLTEGVMLHRGTAVPTGGL
jgi:hypothetical protein